MYGINTNRLQIINSFGTAKHFFETTTKPKSWDEDSRPLDNKRKKHMRLVKTERGYACVLYNTAMVTFLPDELHLCCYNSSSFAFARHYEHEDVRCTSNKGNMFWKVATDDGLKYYTEGNQPLKFIRTPLNKWQLYTDPAIVYENVLDPEKTKPIRKALKEYSTWYRGTKRLGVDMSCHFRKADKYLAFDIFQKLQHNEEINYHEIARNVGSPDTFRRIIYEHLRTFQRQHVLNDRLPSMRYL
jgi:hypothetical protein